MEQLERLDGNDREVRLRKAYNSIITGYAAASLIIALVNIYLGRPYYYLQSFGTLFILPFLRIVHRLIDMKPAYSLNIVIVCYTFLTYTAGVVLRGYKIIPFYDKLMHMMAGTLSMMLALPVFYRLKENHTIEKSDFPLAATFCVFGSVAFAGVWEIAEYLLSLVAGIDTQMVQTTGIHDTMQDMIVCTAGALLFLPFMRDVYTDDLCG